MQLPGSGNMQWWKPPQVPSPAYINLFSRKTNTGTGTSSPDSLSEQRSNRPALLRGSTDAASSLLEQHSNRPVLLQGSIAN